MKKQLKKLLLLLVTTLLVIVAPASVSAAKKPTPGKVKLTKIAATDYNKINVKWNKVSNATHYKIYYKKTGSKNWNYITTVSSKNTSYTHKSSKNDPITCGQKYTYTVKGYNSKYKTNGKYDTKGLTAYTKPTTVKLKKAALSSNKSSVTVTWNKAYGGNYYAVYRKTPSTGWNRIKNLSGRYTSYTDNAPVKGQKNIYTVRCYSTSTKVYGNYNKSGVSVTVPAAVKNYTVKFDAQGGKAVASQTVKSGTTIKMPTTSRSGYKFLGWYTAKTGGSKVTSLKVTKNVTLYAHWQKNAPATIKVQRIELDTADGFSVEVGKTYQVKAKVYPENATNKKIKWVTYGDRITVSDTGLVTGRKEGMTSVTAVATDGSGVQASCEVAVNPSTSIPEPTPQPEKPDVTPTPQPVKKCTVKFDPQGGSPVAPITVDAGTEITLPKSSREGYTLMGWYTMPQGGDRVSDPLLVEDSMMLFAYWKQNQEGVVEDVTIAGNESEILSVWYDEVSTPVDFSKVEYEYQDKNDTFGVLGVKRNSKQYIKMTINGQKRGTVKVFAKYNGKVIKSWNVTVTSDWQEYLGYVSWRKGVESQIWNNSMNVTQKLDAAKSYLKSNYRYGSSGLKVYAYKSGSLDCISASDIFGDMAKDLGLQVKYYNERIGKAFDYIVESYSVSDGHIYSLIMVDGQWVRYDASPMP